jgi:ectoine hydroxylase-related dioxygenase (phytanoyl-CoA dioxygenase family)
VGATADDVVGALRTDGWCIVEGLMTAEQLDRARAGIAEAAEGLPVGRNEFEGYRTQRVYAVFAKTRAFDELAIHPLVLDVVEAILGPAQLSAPVAIVIGPGEAAQVLHRDQSVYPLPIDFAPVVLNTMWALDDFTEENGATRIVPNSMGRELRGDEATIAATMKAGSVAFYVGNLWHGGGANHTDRTRTGVILEYVSAWLRPQENHILAVPRETAAALPERLQELLGYNIYPPFVGYVDGRHPRRFILEPVRPVRPASAPDPG